MAISRQKMLEDVSSIVFEKDRALFDEIVAHVKKPLTGQKLEALQGSAHNKWTSYEIHDQPTPKDHNSAAAIALAAYMVWERVDDIEAAYKEAME